MINKRIATVFEIHAGDYDRWFDEHADVYHSQLSMIRAAVPDHGLMLEIGVGSGRFASPIGIQCGIDPSHALSAMAKSRGVEAVMGVGEHLPFHANSFDTILMMTVICFLDDPLPVFKEAYRLQKPGGTLVVGFIERQGRIAHKYQNEKVKGRFLRYATYYSVDEVAAFYRNAGFGEILIAQKVQGFCVMTGKKQLMQLFQTTHNPGIHGRLSSIYSKNRSTVSRE